MSATDELRRLLDERGVKWGDTGARVYDMYNNPHAYRTEYELSDGRWTTATEALSGTLNVNNLTPEQAIAATLGSDDDYESKMDALLCRLTNGKWSKSRAYDLDFMVSCIDEKYEEDYADELAVTTQGTTEIVRCRDCKHYHKHKWFDIIPGTPLGSDMSDVCMFFGGGVKVEPGGFCKWGERREQ